MKKIKVLKLMLLAFVSLFSAASLTLWWFWEAPLTSPITSLSIFRFLPITDFSQGDKKIVYGFLPYWNLDNVVIQPELTNLGYFSLTIGGDGKILTRFNGETDPGYHKLGSDLYLDHSAQVIENGGQVELVLSQFNNDDIASLLSSTKAQDNLLQSLDSVLLSYQVSGINIDIEPTFDPSASDRQKFTNFIKKLHDHLDSTYQDITLSVDVYASAMNSASIWDIAAIQQHVDYIIVMAYDFHRRSSPLAGPVAPLFGGKELWDSDINTHLKEFLKVVSPDKILLGIPFYGYEWQTTSRDSRSHTFPDTGSTASIDRVNKLLSQKDKLKVQEHWDEDALSPYLSYIENDQTYVIYYENSRSISYKLDYVNQLDLAGVAIWALGYEGDSRELWEVISRKLHQ